jgi:hypothetical protein
MPLGLNARRLKREGVYPKLGGRVVALAMLYLLLPYLAMTAQVSGWWKMRAG